MPDTGLRQGEKYQRPPIPTFLNMATSKKTRQYVGIIAALAAYYLIHEGAHAVSAICMGVFQKIRFMGIGMQMVVADEQMSDTQLGIFCIVGAVSTLITAWILSLLAGRIATAGDGKSDGIRLFRSCMYYISLAMLLIDPLYLSVLCGFFGGGDMNGIKLLIPEIPARIGFAVLLAANGLIFWKHILPTYTKAFSRQ